MCLGCNTAKKSNEDGFSIDCVIFLCVVVVVLFVFTYVEFMHTICDTRHTPHTLLSFCCCCSWFLVVVEVKCTHKCTKRSMIIRGKAGGGAFYSFCAKIACCCKEEGVFLRREKWVYGEQGVRNKNDNSNQTSYCLLLFPPPSAQKAGGTLSLSLAPHPNRTTKTRTGGAGRGGGGKN